jgi:CheY-like chemotaxis protein/HPt (histidine-containing phosphotransfer) domain-containing protein
MTLGMSDPAVDPRFRPSGGRRPIVVLLVDDQRFIGAAVGHLLESEADIELHCCLSAVEAFTFINQVVPTIILQDLVMPDIDGLTLVQSFHTNPQTARTPVVVLSGNDDAGTRARALAAGAAGYLVKLPPKAELIAVIRHHAAQTPWGSDTLDLTLLDEVREAASSDFTRLIDQFIHDAGARVATLKDAAARGDAQALNATAHNLKGSSMIMGAAKLAVLCARVEDQVTMSPGSVVTAALMTEIDQELVRVQGALAAQRERIGQG